MPLLTPSFHLEFMIPNRMGTEISDMDVGNKFKATLSYEVIRKDEHGVNIKINSITFNKTKRI
jgi:hypothetical protein